MEDFLQYHEDPYYGAKLVGGSVLLFWSIIECVYNESKSTSDNTKLWNDPAFFIFMCIGNLLLLSWFWGISIYVWRSRGIDFCRLMGLEDTILAELKQPEKAVFSSTALCSIIFLVLFILYTRSVRESETLHNSLTYAHTLPVLLIATTLASAIFPWKSKKKWLYMLYKVIMAPLYPVCFRDGYVGDLFTSLVRVAVPLFSGLIYVMMAILAWLSNNFDMLGSAATIPWWEKTYIFTGVLVPFLTLYPLWIRLLQCLRRSTESGANWPHHGNALKYTSAIAVISFGAFQPVVRSSSVWIGGLIFATLFQLTWDITMDWGLVAYKKPTGYKSSKLSWWVMLRGFHLRSSRLLGPTWVYIAILIFNTIFRFAWILTVWPYSLADNDSDPMFLQVLFRHIGPFLASVEIIRRMVWGFLRVEWEHVEVFGLSVVTESGSKGTIPSEIAMVNLSSGSDKLASGADATSIGVTDIGGSVAGASVSENSSQTKVMNAAKANSVIVGKSKAELMEAADRDLGSFEQMEVSASVGGNNSISWLASSFSPFLFQSSTSSSNNSSGRVSSEGPVGGISHTQWTQVAELVTIPNSVIAIARYFSLDLDMSPQSSSNYGNSNEWMIPGSKYTASGSGSGSGSGRLRHRARFVESVLFCGIVTLIIFMAANTG